jgi:hypothetical protein
MRSVLGFSLTVPLLIACFKWLRAGLKIISDFIYCCETVRISVQSLSAQSAVKTRSEQNETIGSALPFGITTIAAA